MVNSETVTIDTHLEDEIEFISYLQQEKGILIIPSELNLSGPTSLNLSQIIEIRNNELLNERTLYIWNSSCSNLLCWSPSGMWYDDKWNPIPKSSHRYYPSADSPWSPIESINQWCLMQKEFRCQQINENIFIHGHLLRGLSPVIEMSLPRNNDPFLSIHVDYRERILHDVWIEWNPNLLSWEHSKEDPENIYDTMRRQPSEFIDWQHNIINWIHNHWHKWIIPRFTKTYSDDDVLGRFNDAAQALSDLTGKHVAGFDPRPPVISPREKINANKKK
jgi:hypothetical protein